MSSAGDSERAGREEAPSENGDFAEFVRQWLADQDRLLRLLYSAISDVGGVRRPGQESQDSGGAVCDEDGRRRQQENLRPLVEQVLCHYEEYYSAKRASARRDAALIFDPPWRSSSEKMFMWIGGWRPSMAIQLLYSMSGIQLQDRMDDLLRGINHGCLAALSGYQIAKIDELHRRTVEREREISEETAQVQETIVGGDIVELSHALTEEKHRRDGREEAEGGSGVRLRRRMTAQMATKKEKMEQVLESADTLRLQTLKAVIGILNPLQAAHFLVAAAELHQLVHEWGRQSSGNGGSDQV